jgi:hypothetical protein
MQQSQLRKNALSAAAYGISSADGLPATTAPGHFECGLPSMWSAVRSRCLLCCMLRSCLHFVDLGPRMGPGILVLARLGAAKLSLLTLLLAGLRCVELGAGMGLVGLVLARLGAAVYLTDKPAMTVHARVNAAKNKLLAAAAPAAADGPAAAAPAATAVKQQQQQPAVICPSAGSVTVVGLDWEDTAAAAAAAARITSQGPIDLIVATDCIYPDPSGTVPSSSGFMAAVQALCSSSSSSSSSKRTRVLVSFEARSDELRHALLGAAAAVPGGCSVRQLEQQQLPEGYRCSHIELYELQLGE